MQTPPLFDSMKRLNHPDIKLSDFSERQLLLMIQGMKSLRDHNLGSYYTDLENMLEIDVQLHTAYEKVRELNRITNN